MRNRVSNGRACHSITALACVVNALQQINENKTLSLHSLQQEAVYTASLILSRGMPVPEMLFYERAVPLNVQIHANLKMRPAQGFAYAARSNSAPILASEFFNCAREYPIVFARGDTGLVPMVLLGLREGENLFVDAGGKWAARYVPAFVRRYPFVPAKGAQGELLVCIDEASPCFDDGAGEALFAAGKPTAHLQHALKFLTEFHQGALATEAIMRRLEELKLFREADALVQPKAGGQFRLAGLHVIDEPRLRALASVEGQALFANGTLGLIYAHLVSLGNLAALMEQMPGTSGRSAPATPVARR